MGTCPDFWTPPNVVKPAFWPCTISWLAMKMYLLAIGLQGACKLLAMRRHLLPAPFTVIPGKLV